MYTYIYTYIHTYVQPYTHRHAHTYPAGFRLFRLHPEDTHSSMRTHIQPHTPSHAAAAARGCSSNLRVHVPINKNSYSAHHLLVCLCVFG